jgi:hypothetical protein
MKEGGEEELERETNVANDGSGGNNQVEARSAI